MWNKVATFIKQQRLLDGGRRHIVALSGGADSVALLLVLRRCGYEVEAAHCNFHLRGDESDRDEQFVFSLCEQEGIRLHCAHFDTVSYAQVHHVSIEMAARALRYNYFEQLRRDIDAGAICVAHHQDDAVETLLLNLLRGTGIHGLTGMRVRNGHIVRPLLCVSRAEITAWLDELGQPYVTDSTNLVPDVARNKLRLQVVPLLAEINPAASANIVRTARRMTEVERLFDQSIGETLAAHFRDGVIAIDNILRHPSPECLLHELLSPRGFTPTQTEQLFSCLAGPSGRVFQSPTHEAVVDRRRLVVSPRCEAQPELYVPETGLYRYDNVRFRFSMADEVRISKSADCASLDAAKVSFPLCVRPTRPGDRFQPFGMSGSRLVSDYLTDRKYSVIEKRCQLVITDADGRIVWLVGERTDQRFRIDADTRCALYISKV